MGDFCVCLFSFSSNSGNPESQRISGLTFKGDEADDSSLHTESSPKAP